MRILADDYVSEYIEYIISKDITSTDNVMVKIENNKYNIKTISQVEYTDIPIASETTLGGIIVGNNLSIDSNGVLSATGGGSGGTSNYDDLINKPSINGIELSDNKTLDELGIQPKGNYADVNDIPTKVSELENDSGYLTSYTETDPTVPEWAKESTKPSYTAEEVGALPDTTFIPGNTSDLTNDSGFITNEVEDLVNYYKKSETYTQEEVNNLINDIEDKNNEQDNTLDNHGTRITKLELELGGVENNLSSGNNNLLFGTQLYNLKKWFDNSLQGRYVERESPPEYSSEWWFGGYWYCTKTVSGYTKGKMYQYVDGVWKESTETRKTLNENITINGVTLVENDSSKVNFISGRYASLNGSQISNTGLRQGITPIANNFNKLVFSSRLRNLLTQGEISITVDFYDKYSLTNYLRASSIEPIYRKELVIRPNEITNLSQIEMEIPIQKESELIYGIYSDTSPIDTSQYWINSNDLQLYEYSNSEWIKSNETKTLKDGTNYYSYVRLGSTNKTGYVFSRNDITNYRTLCVDVQINRKFVWVEYIGENAPTPQKGLYWGQESTDKIFRANYYGDVFDSWVEIKTTYSEAVANGIETPIVYPDGEVIVGDIKLEYEKRTTWSGNAKEITSRNFDIGDNGFKISDGENILEFNEDEFKITKNNEIIYDVSEDLTYNKRHKTLESNIDGLITKKINSSGNNMYIRYIR